MKKLFNIIALSLAFAPAMHGDVQENVNALKKQIDVANAQAFQESCIAFLASEITIHERKNALTELEQHAQDTKQQRQDELANMGDANTNKAMLAGGITLAITGGYFGISAAFITPYTGLVSKDLLEFIAEKVSPHLFTFIIAPCFFSGLAALIIGEELGFVNDSFDENDPAVKPVAITLVTAGAIYSYFCLKNGIQFIKKGWNYKEYLKQQIANLDEIIAYIQQAHLA